MAFIPYTFLVLGASILSASAQLTPAPSATAAPAAAGSVLPLTEYSFTYPDLPEQVNPYAVGRGPQSGYNICNSTTEGPNSQCQTMFVNDITDFCLWGSPTAAGTIGDIEAVVVAYCTKEGHGTRLIPPGALTAVQFLKAPGYIQVTGLLDQTGLNLQAGDTGGELDPHGADLAGNPLGGLVFSNNLPTATDNTTITQVHNWNNFLGSGQFCFKACDNSITNPDYCQNIYDTQGCALNMPAAYAPGVFLSCLSDNQTPADPANPPAIPATSSCTTYTSSLIYRTVSTTSTTAAATQTKAPAAAASSSNATPGAATATKGTSASSPNTGYGAGLFAVASSIVMAAVTGMMVLL